MNFTNKYINQYWVADQDNQDHGYLYFVMPTSKELNSPTTLSSTWYTSGWNGSYVFSLEDPGISDSTDAQNFVNAINDITGGARAYLWLTDIDNISSNTVLQMYFDDGSKDVTANFDIPIADGLILVVPSGMPLTLDNGDSPTLVNYSWSRSDKQLYFHPQNKGIEVDSDLATLPFEGPYRGCFIFNVQVNPQLMDQLPDGLQALSSTETGKSLPGEFQKTVAVYPGSFAGRASSVMFVQEYVDQLYVGTKRKQDRGYLYYVLPKNKSGDPVLNLDAAYSSANLHGSFVFTLEDPDLNADNAAAFVSSINALLKGSRAFMWLKDPSNITADTVQQMSINGNASVINATFDVPITDRLSLVVPKAMKIALTNGNNSPMQMNGSQNNKDLSFKPSSAPVTTDASTATLPFDGPGRGSIIFAAEIERRALSSHFPVGCQFLSPGTDPKAPISNWLPLWFPPSDGDPGEMLPFKAAVYPSNPKDVRVPGGASTVFTFLGITPAQAPGRISSTYRSSTGKPIVLWPLSEEAAGPGQVPASLVVERGAGDPHDVTSYYLAPAGDFMLEVDSLPAGQHGDLLGGLGGTEYFTFQSAKNGQGGDWLRFVAGQPAYAPTWPFPEASPVGPAPELDPQLLDNTYTTSWVSLRPGGGNPPIGYVAQPVGSPQFGQDELISRNYPTLYGSLDPAIALRDVDLAFPVAPYGGFTPGDGTKRFDAAQAQVFERQIVSVTRRTIIGDGNPGAGLDEEHPPLIQGRHAPAQDNPSTYTTTTPSGQIVTVASDSDNNVWSKILLAQNEQPALRQMYFSKPKTSLQQAFQTSDLLLVAANAMHLGTLAGDQEPQGPAFYNRINIEDWLIEAAVGRDQEYGYYRNVMIVKGVRGKLYDPDGPPEDNLVASPGKWTLAGKFAAPTTDNSNTPDVNQLIPLSNWLQTYFRAAAEHADSPYYARFNEIAADENWTGILFLCANVVGIPDDLIGLLASVDSVASFSAHHLGIELSQVTDTGRGPALADSSSMFGLITYRDPAAGHAAEPWPVPPLIGQTYDFRLIDLKVLFCNTAVSDFHSTAQLTLNELFGSEVNNLAHLNTLDNQDSPDNANVTLDAAVSAYNSVLLSGKYQKKHGKPMYTLASTGPASFYLDNEILRKVEVTRATMTTRDADNPDDQVYVFNFSGFLDFNIIGAGEDNQLDLFSFGNEAGQDALGQGLAYSDVGLRMSFPLRHPKQVEYTFTSSSIHFDIAGSTPRANSLYTNFALGPPTFFAGGSDSAPKSLGYLSVDSDFRLTGVGEGAWYGLVFRLDMGSPGELAGNAGLTAQLLAGWSPKPVRIEGSYPAELGLALPGTGSGAEMISLQNVMSLSMGQRRLVNAPIDGQPGKRGYLLTLDNIALRFMGVAKLPPIGSAMFYLFGNPHAGGDPSGLGWYAMYGKDS